MAKSAKLESFGAPLGPRTASVRVSMPRLGLVYRLRLAWRQRQARLELGALDERMLRDIGINRGEIEHVIRFGRSPF